MEVSAPASSKIRPWSGRHQRRRGVWLRPALGQETDAYSSVLDDDAFIEVQIKRPRKTEALFPVGFLRRYLAAQSVPGRKLLLFDSDEEVSSQESAGGWTR